MRFAPILLTCLAIACAPTPAAPEAPASPAREANASPTRAEPARPPPPTAAPAPSAPQHGHAQQGTRAAESAPPEGHSGHHHAHGGAGYEMDFSEVERFARHFDDPKRDAWQLPEQVITHLEVAPGQTVADIGAGTGYFLPYLSRAVGAKGKVWALDVEPNMVLYMQQRAAKAGFANVEARHVAADDPGLAPESADRILIVNTWHHIGQREDYAKKLRAALRPGGSVLVVDFTMDSDIGPPRAHRLAPSQVEQELAAGGLDAHTVEKERLPKQYLVRGTRER